MTSEQGAGLGLPEVEAGVAPATGGAESFEAFYVREYPAVVRLAYALSGSRLVAGDIAQDAFLRAFHEWQRIRQPAACTGVAAPPTFGAPGPTRFD